MISKEGAASARRNGGKMPCESCAVQFSVFKRKRVCCECERCYCSGCLRRGGGAMCAPCRVLSTRPLARASIAHLKVRDLQCFLQRQNVSTRGCVEKDELLSLCVSHVNSAAYRRHGGARGYGVFTFKGMTNNFNEFITSAFDLRPAGPQTAPPPPSAPPPTQPRTGCYNSAHVHIVIPPPPPQPNLHCDIRQERFTVTPGGERDVRVSPPGAEGEGEGGGVGVGGVSRTSSRDSAHVDSADCFEIEDVDEAGWEFVTRPADPLPNDSEILLTATDPPPAPAPRRDSAPQTRPQASVSREHFDPGSPGLGLRAASSLELRSSPSVESVSDTASLKDEPSLDAGHKPDAAESGSEYRPSPGARVSLGALRSARALESLSVRQLKELLARNRVEYRGCIERADLLARAHILYRDHAHYKDELDNLPLEECCKICMAAPLECVLLECGHIAACTACAKQLAECPICRQYVVRAVRFFRS